MRLSKFVKLCLYTWQKPPLTLQFHVGFYIRHRFDVFSFSFFSSLVFIFLCLVLLCLSTVWSITAQLHLLAILPLLICVHSAAYRCVGGVQPVLNKPRAQWDASRVLEE